MMDERMQTMSIDDTPADNEQTDVGMEKDDIPTLPWYKNWKTWLKIIIIVIVLTFIVLAIIFNKITGEILNAFLDWMRGNIVLGSFAFIALYWFCTVMFIPGSLLTLGAGAIYSAIAGQIAGPFLATLVVILGAGLGASTAFLLGRFVFREKVEGFKQKYEKFAVIDKVVENEGLKVTLLLRLSPLIPFAAFNYIMGLTGVSFRSYNIAHVGMIPGTLAYCFIGSIASAAAGFDNPLVLVLTIVGTIIAIIGMVYISWVAKKEFNKIAARAEEEKNDGDVEAGLTDNDQDKDKQTPNDEETKPTQNEEEPEQSLSLGN